MRTGTRRWDGLPARLGVGITIIAALLLGNLTAAVAAQEATPMAEATPTVPDACQTETPAAEPNHHRLRRPLRRVPLRRGRQPRLAAGRRRPEPRLITLDNEYDPQVALTNADTLVLRGSNVAIEFRPTRSGPRDVQDV